jgi:hypothetical protein
VLAVMAAAHLGLCDRRQALAVAEETIAISCLGLANVLNGAWKDALEALEVAWTIGRERRLSVFEGGVLLRSPRRISAGAIL